MSTDNNLTLTFLGSGDAFATNRYWNSILVNDNILLDASPIILPHLKRLHKPLQDIDYIFVTHFHGDHLFGLPFLFLEYYLRNHRQNPLKIVGPVGLERITELLFELSFPDIMETVVRPFVVDYKEIAEPGNYNIDNISFDVVQMRHSNKLVSYGYKLVLAGKILAYSGDTGLCKELYELASGADILILEVALGKDKEAESHLNPKHIEQIRAEVPDRTKIILTHIGPSVVSIEDVIWAEDFGVYVL